MRIMVVYNRYTEYGGEDAVYEAETALLKYKGHEVLAVEDKNDGEVIRASAAIAGATYSIKWRRNAKELIGRNKIDVMHVHNLFWKMSIAVLHAAGDLKTPTVFTCHNYRVFCLNAKAYRETSVCTDCLAKWPWRGVVRGCWHGRMGSVVPAMAWLAWRLTEAERWVDRFIAVSKFQRELLIASGIPSERVVVKPNFVFPDPGLGRGTGAYAIFVGKLTPEKGLRCLLRAWSRLGRRIPLRIVGDGPLKDEVERAVAAIPGVEYLGPRSPHEVFELMGEAAFLVFPSEWYEGFPRVLVEAFAKGLPVVCSGMGSHGSLVEHGRTGLHFRPGDPDDLAEKVEWMLAHPARVAEMRREARREYEEKYTAERNYEMLMRIYEEAIEHRRSRTH